MARPPKRSRRWLLPAAVVLLWLFIGGPLGYFAAQLSGVQENDNADFLPRSAESTRVLERLAEFSGKETLPATVVFERSGGLTPKDRAAILGYVEELEQVDNVDGAAITGPIPSGSGEAAQVVVPIATADGDEMVAAVEGIRTVVQDAPSGLTALVGGQGGILGDFIEAFGAIDGLLLVVALLVVLVILVAVYRTPVLPLVVLLGALLALSAASAVTYALASTNVLDVNGQSQGILFILAVGAATDYSLLIVARFREQLRDTESKYEAMGQAYRGALEPILASGATVVLGLLCLLFSDLSSLRGLGPVGALGVTAAVFSSLTLLPAALVLLGRHAFWPFGPRFGSAHTDGEGIWGRVARLVGRRARAVWVVTFVLLAACAAFVQTLDEDPIPQTELFLTEVDSVKAQRILDSQFEADRGAPAILVVPVGSLPAAIDLIRGHDGVAPNGVVPLTEGPPSPQAGPKVIDGESIVLVTLSDAADSAPATGTIQDLRAQLDEVSKEILVGGSTAILLDTRVTTEADRNTIIPMILAVVFVVLALLLRSLLAPLILLVANVLSFGATVGISALLFNHVFDFPASDPSTLLIGFVFLVALGIDYSIFLMTRVREESIRQGTHPGVLKGLSVTGGVITSAGVVLAATFAALSVVPILFLAQIAFIVAFGVLLDTLVVRSLLVPALSYDFGPAIWWPGRLWQTPDHADADTAEMIRVRSTYGVRERAVDDADGTSTR